MSVELRSEGAEGEDDETGQGCRGEGCDRRNNGALLRFILFSVITIPRYIAEEVVPPRRNLIY